MPLNRKVARIKRADMGILMVTATIMITGMSMKLRTITSIAMILRMVTAMKRVIVTAMHRMRQPQLSIHTNGD
jgi:hypothetical protein